MGSSALLGLIVNTGLLIIVCGCSALAIAAQRETIRALRRQIAALTAERAATPDLHEADQP